jgi:hypothetical protein
VSWAVVTFGGGTLKVRKVKVEAIYTRTVRVYIDIIGELDALVKGWLR